MSEHIVLDEAAIARTLTRLSHEIVEKNKGTDFCLLGIRRRGEILARRVQKLMRNFTESAFPATGSTSEFIGTISSADFLFPMRS